MKILMFNYEYPPLGGGGGVFTKQLAEELVKCGNTVTVITSSFNLHKQVEMINGVEILRVPIFMRSDQNAASHVSMVTYFPTSLYRGFTLLRKRAYDLIHTLFAIPSAPSAVFLAKYFNAPHLLSILGGDIYDPSKRLSPHKTPILHFAVKKIIDNSDRVVALSMDIKKRAIEHYQAGNDIDVIHLGIPEPVFQPKSKESFGFKKQDTVLVTVGRLVRRKGISDLIRAIKQLQEFNVKLAVIGDGPEKEHLVSIANSLGLRDQIIFWGYVSEETKFQILNISDIYVSTSHHEGFGIVFLEAMTAGLPIVCFDKGGQAEFLIDGKTGYLVEYGKIDLFILRLGQLCSQENEIRRIRDFNKNYVRKFLIETCGARYQKIYKAILANKN
jgi:glycosyltransferase involved in cell wall biosynthesis